jgi:hypothetical protein
MLVVLFGMVALAVDVGQTYAEQRNIVRGTNAAALAGMNKYLANGTDANVRMALEQSLAANGVRVAPYGEPPEPGERILKAVYIDASGSQITSCPEVGGCPQERVGAVKYIRVDVDGKVDTYFARLFGASDLPVSSNAFSKLGYCTSGYYPIGVRYTIDGVPTIDADGFIKNDGIYTDETYNEQPLKFKKLYLHGISNSAGGFSILRWHKDNQPSGNRDSLAMMLAGDGNVADGFTEAPWPNIPEGPPEYEGYPREPGIFSGSEWIYGSDFNQSQPPFTGSVLPQLEYHKKNRTLMTLPLYRYDNGNTTNPAYYVETLGSFLLLDYGRDDGGDFLTLAYVREGGKCAQLETNPPPSDKLVLKGNVAYIPRWQVLDPTDRPIQFLVVLDVTGSMSWNFDGQGKKNGSVVSCVDGSTTCTSGPDTAWGNEKERRIYIAKDVLSQFVDRMKSDAAARPYDVMRIVTFAGDFGDYINSGGDVGNEAGAVNDLTKVYPDTWTNNDVVLKEAILKAGQVGSPYITDGATPSAVGLARATQVFDAAPDKAPNGQEYRRVVIFVTDGVANVLRNGMLNNYNNCSSETVGCQAGRIPPGDPNGVLAPLNAMIVEAQNLYQEHIFPSGGDTYVVALGSNTDKTGLDAVSSTGPAAKADDPEALEKIFADLQQDAVYGECRAAVGERTDTMAADRVGKQPDGFDDLTDNTVGFIYLESDTGYKPAPIPIVADPISRKLSYVAEDLPQGTYSMKAFIGYRAPEDKTARSYSLFVDSLPNTPQLSVEVTPGAASLNAIVERSFTLDLNGSICGGAGS